jgi:cytidylate kinase
VQRRQEQVGARDPQKVQQALEQRDLRDSQRTPLQPAEDAYYINTDDLDIQSVIAQVRGLITAWQVRNAQP